MTAGIKEKILTASYAMFRDKGYEQSTLRAIAEDCGITHANILYHFNGKADIAKHIIIKYLNALERETNQIAEREAIRPSVAKATLFWVAHLCYMVVYPDFARVYVDMLRKNRNLIAEITTSNAETQIRNPIGELFNAKTREKTKAFVWKMEVLTDADYHTIEMLEGGELTLREAALYMIDLISMLFTGKKIPAATLERSISLMLDLVKEESLNRIHDGCDF